MKQFFLLLFFFTICFLNAQNLQWVNGMGSSAADFANSVTTDASGNVYHAGGFNGSVDFDPSGTVFSLTAGGTSSNGYISKLTAANVFVWSVGFLGTNECNLRDVKTDATGNVYITGFFSGTIDFNPGAGTFTMSTSSASDYDVFVCKLNSSGVFQWAKKIGGAYTDYGNAIALDGTGNVYVAGYTSSSTSASTVIDFDPGVAVANFTIGYSDGFLLKLDNNGNYVAAQSYGTFNNYEQVTSLAIDASNNVYLGGFFEGNVSNLSLTAVVAFSKHPFVAKLNSALTLVWSVKYTPSGTNPAGSVNALKVDASGNVYNTGYFEATYDFDPSAGVSSLSSAGLGDVDVFVAKLSSTGTLVWVDKIASGAGDSYSTGLTIDAANNVLVSGYFTGTADFDPTANSYFGYSAGSNDAFVCRLDQNGAFNNSIQTHGSSGDDRANIIHAISTGPYYIGGIFSNTVDFNITASTNTIISNGVADLFLAKYNQCATPIKPAASTPTAITICPNTQTVISVSAISGVTFDWYTAATGGVLLGTGNTFTTPSVANSTSYWAQASNTCSTNQIRTQFSVNVSGTTPTINISASSSTICEGAAATLTASGATTYLWNTAATTSVVSVAPIATTLYTVTGTIGSCSATKTINITVTQNPTVNISATSSSICLGSNTSLIASGATSYTWNTGSTTASISVSPTITTVYTATGSASSCFDTHTISISIVANPTVVISASSSSICSGSSATLSASGASTYTWSNGVSSATNIVSPTVNTVYTATGTAVSGCKDTHTISVTINPTPTVTVNNYTVCPSTSVTIFANGASTYSWSTGATTQSVTVAPSVNTTYTVVGTSSLGCTNTKTLSVSMGTSLSINITASSASVCVGNSATLTASGATTYTWIAGPNGATNVVFPSGNQMYQVNGTTGSCTGSKTITILGNANPNVLASASPTLLCGAGTVNFNASGANTMTWSPMNTTGFTASDSPLSTTIYSVTGTNNQGCTTTRTLNVVVSSTPTLAVSGATVCSGISATVSANGAPSYSWNTGATTSSISVTPTVNTTYSVTGNNSGCTSTKTVQVVVNAIPNVSVSSSTICSGSTGTLVANGANTYSWNTGATGSNLFVSPSSNTNYTVTGTSVAGCVNTSTASVTVGSAPSIAVNSQSICAGNTTTLAASGVTTYTWNTGSNLSDIIVTPVATTVYTVSGNLTGCVSTAVQVVTVTVNELPNVSLANITSPLCVNNSSVSLSGIPSGGSYTGTGVSGASFDPSVSGTGTFTVTYNYTDVNSCSGVDTKTVSVSLCTSLPEAIKDNLVAIFPNPSNGYFTLSFNNKGIYKIINSLGQNVKQIEVTNDNEVIEVNDISTGIYYIIGKNTKEKIIITY